MRFVGSIKSCCRARTDQQRRNCYLPERRQDRHGNLKTPYYDAEGKPAGLIGISRDITDRKKKEERIEYLSVHDIMTGLYSRMYFDTELYRTDSTQALPYSVIMVDINSLKLTNDLFGHSEGDKLIVQTAELLKKCCGRGIIARVGGDEFSVLLPGVDEEELKNIIGQMNQELEKERESKQTFVLLSISYGYARKTARSRRYRKY